MKNKELKKIQRYVNKQVKRVNDSILNDSLWNGRFVVKQTNRINYRYWDGCGYYSNFAFELKDLKTNKRTLFLGYHINNNDVFFPCHLFEALNNFIIDNCKVWEDKDDPREDKTIYRTK